MNVLNFSFTKGNTLSDSLSLNEAYPCLVKFCLKVLPGEWVCYGNIQVPVTEVHLCPWIFSLFMHKNQSPPPLRKAKAKLKSYCKTSLYTITEVPLKKPFMSAYMKFFYSSHITLGQLMWHDRWLPSELHWRLKFACARLRCWHHNRNHHQVNRTSSAPVLHWCAIPNT